jgi:hypothetical protein
MAPVVGTAVAAGVGYAVGTAAGRAQARRLAELAGRAGRSAPVAGTAGFVGGKLSAVARLVVEWLKDAGGVALGWRNGDEAADAIVIDLAEELAHAINEHGSRPGGHPSRPVATVAPRPRRALAQASSR